MSVARNCPAQFGTLSVNQLACLLLDERKESVAVANDVAEHALGRGALLVLVSRGRVSLLCGREKTMRRRAREGIPVGPFAKVD